ncbi:Uncharacterised protein [Chlamydia trachomatis]|nr:Uncharacterised protein [Chlamydia trachomatis]
MCQISLTATNSREERFAESIRAEAIACVIFVAHMMRL